MNDYQVSVDVDLAAPASDDQADALLDGLTSWCGSIATQDLRLEAALSVDAPDMTSAVSHGITAVVQACSGAGLTVTNVVRSEGRTGISADAHNSAPPLTLVSTGEVMEILGVSRSRVYQLRETHHSFPEPLAELRCGPIWDRADLNRFIEEWDRSNRPTLTANIS